MESSRLLTCLAADYARIRDVIGRDMAADVPTCPGWTVTDLAAHLAEVYLHKTECIRLREFPKPWPPDLSGEQPLTLLDRAYAAISTEFDRRAPDDPARTWYEPDQTVNFWIRRMAQETVIHRLDAELAVGVTVDPIAEDLAVDGIEEVLTLFLDYGSKRWHEDFGPALQVATGITVLVTTSGGGWLIRTDPKGVDVRPAPVAAAPDATVSGAPDEVLRWLWARDTDIDTSGGRATGTASGVRISGDDHAVTELRGLLAAATI